MERLSFRFTLYGLLLLCAFWSVTDCSTTTKPPVPDVEVTVVDRTENSITIRFYRSYHENIIAYILFDGDRPLETITVTDNAHSVEHTQRNLSSAHTYKMTLRSQSNDGRLSPGFKFDATTAPENVDSFTKVHQTISNITLAWTKKAKVQQYSLVIDGTENRTFTENDPAEYTVPNLSSATRYNFIMYSRFEDIPSSGFRLSASTAPSEAEDFQKISQNTSSITLQWKNAGPDISYSLRYNEQETNFTSDELGTPATYSIPGLQNTTLYDFTLVTFFDNIPGIGVSIQAATEPRFPSFRRVDKTESSITLSWESVPGVTEYILESVHGPTTIKGRTEETVTNLESGTMYNFRLFSVFEKLSSSGNSIFIPTVPLQVSSVDVVERNVNTIKLQWQSLRSTWVYELTINGKTETLKPKQGSVSYTVPSLNPGTVYPFDIKTVFTQEKSLPYEDSTVTVIDCTKVEWVVTETSIQGVVNGAFTTASASNGSQPELNSGSGNEVKFTGLYPGAKYDMTLKYKELEQCRHSLHIVPPGLNPKCKNCKSGYSLCVEWDPPSGVWDFVEIAVSGDVYQVGQNGELKAEIPGFKPAQKYKASISSLSGPERSAEKQFTCKTDDRGVIAGSFFGVLLFLILLCAVAFVMLRRPDIIRRNKSPKGGARTSVRKSKGIPVEKFPAHFNVMSADENKGFSLEYEDLAPVGTDQSQKAATTQENKTKNRFVNVLPYDRSRVKLTTIPHNDYINASYMPGYNSDREFIAAQGPMPSTVADFWRMIWEQRVRGVVMVTNCTEGGRTKCEQYWADSDARVCGDLAVFTTSQRKEANWTLREFTVKHRLTSEERSVKHFHFTAWPDHGVPEGTEVLIQFRALVRKHIELEAQGTPTLVHGSAGVGSTGTLIALDMLLLQLEREKMVDINGFVHKMRLNRPHMVQTESQYVFLHQCVLDRLQLNQRQEENIYENELIYANATALREYQNNFNNV